jgi:uncharacterized protein YjiS (DUF1127 family)
VETSAFRVVSEKEKVTMSKSSSFTVAKSLPSNRSVRGLFESLLMTFQRHQTIVALLDLNDHHLRDIGLARADLMDGLLNRQDQ